MNIDHTKISRFLSFVLRYKPQDIGLTLDSEGWADINTLLACCHQGRQKTHTRDPAGNRRDQRQKAFHPFRRWATDPCGTGAHHQECRHYPC